MYNWSIEEALENIIFYGYYVLKEAIDQDVLFAITASYKAALDLQEPFVHIVELGNGCLYNAPKSTLKKFGGFDSFDHLFHTSQIAKVAHAYMNKFFDYPLEQVNQVFEIECNDRNGSTSGSPLHFDMVPSLKTIIYLDVTTKENGATRVLPGSHIQVREFALSQLLINTNPLQSDSFLCNPDRYRELYLEGRPGTVIFLDTYCIHGGGVVHNGAIRRSVRAVSWARPLNQHYFSNTVFNFSHVKDFAGMRFYNPAPNDSAVLPTHDSGSNFRFV